MKTKVSTAGLRAAPAMDTDVAPIAEIGLQPGDIMDALGFQPIPNAERVERPLEVATVPNETCTAEAKCRLRVLGYAVGSAFVPRYVGCRSIGDDVTPRIGDGR